jgi:adenosylcobinamide-phosphate synthase
MSLISIIISAGLEQLHALPVERAWCADPQAALAGFLEDKFNDGGRSHGAIAWGLGVALPAAPCSRCCMDCCCISSRCWPSCSGIGVLYLTMGFRQFSHFFTNIHLALRPATSTRRVACSPSGAA